MNGRVDAMTAQPNVRIEQGSLSSPAAAGCSTVRAARAGVHTSTPLNELFFSNENVEALQEGIRYKVWVESEGDFKIGHQNERELTIIMRSMYYQHGRNAPTDIVGQVRELNGHVLAWAVPEIITNMKQHEQYKKDISTLPMPMPHAPLVTMKGTRSLEMKMP
jgi:hypothetical protein